MQNIPKIKICGITNIDDATYALRLGADSLGFIFYGRSKRYIIPEDAKVIIDSVRKIRGKRRRDFLSCSGNTTITGVFVNEKHELIESVVKDLNIDIIQLSGTESIDYIEKLNLNKNRILKAVHIKNKIDTEMVCHYKKIGINVLLDTYADDAAYGGTGVSFDLNLLRNINLEQLIIAGGIGPDNISYIMKNVRPYGFDLSSKVEDYPGKKDYKKMSDFFDNFKGALYEIS